MANVVVLRDDTTGRVWNFGAAPAGVFTFGPPYNQGNYTLVNMSAANITVALLGQTYTVPAHTTWNFLANANMAPAKPTVGTGAPAKQTKVHAGESVPTSADYPFTAAQAQPPAPPLEEEEPTGSGPVQPNRTTSLTVVPEEAPKAEPKTELAKPATPTPTPTAPVRRK